MRFSVVVPAHNEARLLPKTLAAIAAAAAAVAGEVEVIVVANRCTDSTATLARDTGAVVVPSDARNISAVRNAGAADRTNLSCSKSLTLEIFSFSSLFSLSSLSMTWI